MERCEEDNLWVNRDWDPCYLSQIFSEDFNDFTEMWSTDVTDSEIVTEAIHAEHYCPLVEDISLDDAELCTAVEKIEEK